ncbi:hypothetical protein VNO77_24815 [Canavalia gladiata]|uniref:Uncharacterized protein n=1 Tax=Canavalia gladiata TaxID=3824 RepID=A0AAN9QCZ0_CANGL
MLIASASSIRKIEINKWLCTSIQFFIVFRVIGAVSFGPGLLVSLLPPSNLIYWLPIPSSPEPTHQQLPSARASPIST